MGKKKNIHGGKGAKKQASKNASAVTRNLLFKEDGQNYGKIIKNLGSCRFEVFGMDGTTYLGIVRGKMRNKVWIRVDNFVLFTYRDFEVGKVDIIHKYSDDEVKRLVSMDEISKKMTSDLQEMNNPIEDDNIDFDEI